MPFIHVRSLPLDEAAEIREILVELCRDFSEETGIDREQVHATWEFLQPGHYARGDRAPHVQPRSGHPLLVELLAPDFNDAKMIERMFHGIALSLSRRVGFPLENIFISYRAARSGEVYDQGQIVRWQRER
jgi:phenylpyruvate tautomerase PptA (4-oxalocrotonate tautomerase family)